MNSFLTILLFLALTLPLSAADTQITNVDPKTAAALIAGQNVTVLDVRTSAEFKEGHLEGAINHDFLDNTFKEQVAALDKNQPYLVHCESGGRSARALKILRQLDFKTLYHLEGGIRAWEQAGQPIKK